ncbi:MAG: hypothetical protein IT165_04215 [Bryobacterales bacterium]|nr:hypothetical protein [Bryobacterales bacterium]
MPIYRYPFLLLFCAAAFGQAQPRGWQPQDYQARQDPASGKVSLSTPYYRFQHDARRGGIIDAVSLTHGRARNLLIQPMESRVRLMVKRDVSAGQNPSRMAKRDVYSDLNDPAPVISLTGSGKSPVVTVDAALMDQAGKPSGIRVKTTYSYRWGYVKIRRQFIAPKPVSVISASLLTATFDPSLEDYGWRPAVSEEMGNSPHTWQNGQIREWGKMRAGTHFDLPFRTRYVPRYLVLANQNVEGIEWFMSDDLAQFDYQMTGQPGTGYCELSAGNTPLGINVSIDPVNLPYQPYLARGGYITLEGTYTFDYYLAIPILEGHAQKPWLHESLRGVRLDAKTEISEEGIRKWAEAGVRELTIHNDGDAYRDGLFWRDGSYPPYPPETMKKMDALLGWCRRNGVRIAPYFSNHELHQSTREFKEHGEEWGRKPDDQANLRPNYYYGAHMCLKSGWLDFFKFSVDRVLKNHPFEGVYYDWNVALFCNNPRHVGKTSSGVNGGRGLAALALSPTGHWDIDELIQLAEWTRERVGPDGLFIIHNTLVPMYVTENFSDHVVGMEFSYGRISTAMPPLEDLPLEWAFAGARSRGVIVTGTVSENAPRRILRLHALAGLMTAVTPWRANDEAIELAGKLRPLGDIETYQFQDWRNNAVKLESRGCYSALYSRPGETWVLLANFNAEPRQVVYSIDAAKLPYPLSAGSSRSGERITLPAGDVTILHLRE